MTDQLRHPTVYESDELRRFRREKLTAETSLRDSGVSFERHYAMSAACAPSRASIMTGQYPSLHGVTQTDGLAKSADGPEMFWLASDTVPTIGDWFRAGGYRTFYKGKWHVSHAHLPAPDGEGYLQTLDKDGNVNAENVAAYLKADLLDAYGSSEWVGPEAHGLGHQNTGTARDPFTADETIALLKRLDQDGNKPPWLTVCSFLNPHDISMFGVIALAQGLRYDFNSVPNIPAPPTQEEDLSTKPTCQQSYVDAWGKILAPQPHIEPQRRFYYQLQRTVDDQIGRVLAALRAPTPTRTQLWFSPPITGRCSAPTAGCTRSGITPTRRPPMSRSSSPALCFRAGDARVSPQATRTCCPRCSGSLASITTRRSSALPPATPKRALWWDATSRASFAAPRSDRPTLSSSSPTTRSGQGGNSLSALTRGQRSSGGTAASVRLDELNIGLRAALAGAAAQIQVVALSGCAGIRNTGWG